MATIYCVRGILLSRDCRAVEVKIESTFQFKPGQAKLLDRRLLSAPTRKIGRLVKHR